MRARNEKTGKVSAILPPPDDRSHVIATVNRFRAGARGEQNLESNAIKKWIMAVSQRVFQKSHQ
jgi:hypothetical protein